MTRDVWFRFGKNKMQEQYIMMSKWDHIFSVRKKYERKGLDHGG